MEMLNSCLTDLDKRGGIQDVTNHIRELDYGDRLDLLKQKSEHLGFTLLTKLVEVMNSSSGREERFSVGHQESYINSIQLILDSVNPSDRYELLKVGDAKTKVTALHVACEYDDIETVKCIMDSIGDPQEKLDLLLLEAGVSGHNIHGSENTLTDKNRSFENRVQLNPLLLAAFLNKGDLSCLTWLITDVILPARTGSNSDGSEERWLLSQTSDGQTLLHLVARASTMVAVKQLLEILPHDPLKKLIRSADHWNRTPLHRKVWGDQNSDALVAVLKSATELFTPAELKGLLLSQDTDEQTFLHLCAEYGSAQMMRQLLTLITPSLAKKLLMTPNKICEKPLHKAAHNSQHPDLIQEMLMFIMETYKLQEAYEILKMVDNYGITFFSWVAFFGSVQMISGVMEALPADVSRDLSTVVDGFGTVAGERAPFGLSRDWIHQAGSYPLEFYYLETAPQVLIFYSSKDRQSPATLSGERTDAEAEKDCVMNYFMAQGFPCTVVENPTADKIFSQITVAVNGGHTSGLVVFVMTHGQKGLVIVEGTPAFMLVEEIITHMCIDMEDKPKMLIVQACQNKVSSPSESAHISKEGDLPREVSRCADILPQGSSRQQALREGVSLKRSDFLLYMATVSGEVALRNLMIPCLINSIRELRPSDCVTQACISTNRRVKAKLARDYPGSGLEKCLFPKSESSLQMKFCLGKKFQLEL